MQQQWWLVYRAVGQVMLPQMSWRSALIGATCGLLVWAAITLLVVLGIFAMAG